VILLMTLAPIGFFLEDPSSCKGPSCP
jgi:hypothetical protein